MRRRVVERFLTSRQVSILRLCAIGFVVGLILVDASWSASFAHRPRAWAAVAAVALAMVFALLLTAVRQSVAYPGMVPFALGCAAAAMYGCVPETDQMPGVGWAIAAVVIVEVARQQQLPVVWHSCTGALVLWSGLYGATGRQSALIGALFACLPIPLLGVWIILYPRLRRVHEVWRWVILGLGCCGAVVMARTGGISPTTMPAVRWAVLWFGVLVVSTGGVAVFAVSAWPWFRQRK